jgi:hypothetical protein
LKLTVPNPTTPAGRKPVHLITDRAKRYRANATPPARRSEFASDIWSRRREHGTAGRGKSLDSDIPF